MAISSFFERVSSGTTNEGICSRTSGRVKRRMSSSSSAACCGFEAFTFFFSAYFFPCLSRDVKISISIPARARISKRSSREMTYRESREDFWFQQLSLSLSWCSARARARGGVRVELCERRKEKVLLMFVSSYFNEVFFYLGEFLIRVYANYVCM